jgi:hypothetical protein
LGHVQLYGPGTGSLAYDEIQLEVFHGRIEDFFYHVVQAVNLVNEKNIARFQVSKDGGEVPGTFQHRSRGCPDVNVEFLGNDIGNGGFPEARKAVDKHVIKGLVSGPCRFNEDSEVVLDPVLTDEIAKAQGSQTGFKANFLSLFFPFEQTFVQISH